MQENNKGYFLRSKDLATDVEAEFMRFEVEANRKLFNLKVILKGLLAGVFMGTLITFVSKMVNSNSRLSFFSLFFGGGIVIVINLLCMAFVKYTVWAKRKKLLSA